MWKFNFVLIARPRTWLSNKRDHGNESRLYARVTTSCHFAHFPSFLHHFNLFLWSVNNRIKIKMLTLIGLGLGDVKDITLNGLEAIKNADKVFLEAYTSVLCAGETQKQMVRSLTFSYFELH
jgi:hypothetical protein